METAAAGVHSFGLNSPHIYESAENPLVKATFDTQRAKGAAAKTNDSFEAN